jgi:ubiquinone/menaquinone biosynthesis C-methylase UbiE
MHTHAVNPHATHRARAVADSVHAVRGRFNAAFFHLVDWYLHRTYGDLKSELFAGLPAALVEIGAGTGANMRYFRAGTRVVAVEPNPYMHGWLAARARKYGVDVEIHSRGAEQLDLATGSVEAVVASLVLCTVREPEAVLQEIRRVLVPGGRFVCIEHVAAPASSLIGRIQRVVHRPWQWCFEGCHTHRDTGTLLKNAGFANVSIRPFVWQSAFVPVRPQIAAVCIR